MKQAQDFIDEVSNEELQKAYGKTNDTTLRKFEDMGIELYI